PDRRVATGPLSLLDTGAVPSLRGPTPHPVASCEGGTGRGEAPDAATLVAIPAPRDGRGRDRARGGLREHDTPGFPERDTGGDSVPQPRHRVGAACVRPAVQPLSL